MFIILLLLTFIVKESPYNEFFLLSTYQNFAKKSSKKKQKF